MEKNVTSLKCTKFKSHVNKVFNGEGIVYDSKDGELILSQSTLDALEKAFGEDLKENKSVDEDL